MQGLSDAFTRGPSGTAQWGLAECRGAHVSSDYIVWFQDYHPSDKPRVGGKNASLGEMIAAGLPVPPGFALSTEAYHTLREPPRRCVRRRQQRDRRQSTSPIR